jgi:hypothetical protein
LRLDITQEDRRPSEEEILLRQELKIRVLGLAALERSRRRQAARINYIRAGDACTRFFHLRMFARKRKQYIPSLKRQDGTLAWNHEDKQQVLQDYFQRQIGTKERRHHTIRWENIQVTKLQQLPGLQLDRSFTEGEIE